MHKICVVQKCNIFMLNRHFDIHVYNDHENEKTMLVYNSNNINISNNHISPQLTEHKKRTTAYNFGKI